jgi:hypothetical protein
MLVLGIAFLFVGTALAQSDSTTAALLSDAQTHSSLNGEQNSGHDSNGFFLAGNGARLNIGGDLQFRYTYNPSRSDSVFGDNAETGFDIPLAKLRFSGYLNETIDFMFETGYKNNTGDIRLYNAYAGLKAFDHGRFQIGQFRLPFLKEQSIADRYQLAANRSITSSVFGQGYSQGVQFSYNLDNLRLTGAISDGFDTANTDYTDPDESDLALTARAEYAILGSFNDFTEFTSTQSQQNALLAGAAFHYQDGDTQDAMYTYTGDLTWKYSGWNAFVSGIGRNIETTGGGFDDFGVVLQGGYRVTEQIEPFARYDAVFADSDRGLSNNDFNFVTAGVNYYIYGQAAKFTADAVWSLNETTGLDSMANFSNTGLLGSSDENEVAFRMQFQVLF